ncbi:hypothetical protein [Methanobacterium petrolearium]|uniref:hypothetical protein n=1 Tax=Methanobacterium petrolearium TaxID=710190 RepID=UPI001AEB29D0|nr:hypothetical protein [Methanobacterium petrolearium]
MVSAGDEVYNYYLTLESDHTMGMSVVGAANSMRAFNYACSSSISPIEGWVMQTLFPNGDGYSVTIGIGEELLNGTTINMYQSNGYIVITAVNGSSEFILVDPETGIVRDIFYGTYCGGYCFPNQQTEWASDLGEALWANNTTITDILINCEGSIDLSQIPNNIKEGLTGFISSVMISLQWANMFIIDNIPFNLFSTFAGFDMIGLAVNNAYMGSKIEEKDYTTIYGSNYTLEKNENNLTLEEAQIIVQTHPNAFEYDAWESLQEALEDKNQRAAL